MLSWATLCSIVVVDWLCEETRRLRSLWSQESRDETLIGLCLLSISRSVSVGCI